MIDITKITPIDPSIKYIPTTATNCIICNDTIILNDCEVLYHNAFVCDKCRAAVLKIRREMEEETNERDE